MSWTASLSGHIDGSPHDAEETERQLVSDLKAVVAKYPQAQAGGSFFGQYVGQVSLKETGE
jgi:hypothetical protein